MKARISTLARKVEELEGKRLHEVQAVTENTAQANPSINCQPTGSPRRTLSECSLSEGFYVRTLPMRGPIQDTTECPIR